jgi:hypothetical protein
MTQAVALFGFLQGVLHPRACSSTSNRIAQSVAEPATARSQPYKQPYKMVPQIRSNATKISEDAKTPIETAGEACHD